MSRRAVALAALSLAVIVAVAVRPAAPAASASSTPIQHVVILYLENHSFDNVLGELCVEDARCDGATSGQVATGETISLSRANDVVVGEPHGFQAEKIGIDGGKMDGFSKYRQCSQVRGYSCYTQFYPDQIPNLAAFARSFTISDRTFELRPTASYPSHIEIVAATTAGFIGGITRGSGTHHGPGWGCDSGNDAQWRPLAGGAISLQPSCVPNQDGSGPYRPSLVQYAPTIMDRLDEAALSWHIYAPSLREPGYTWSICPTFAECLYGTQFGNMREPGDVITDAQTGQLPAYSVVVPLASNSQHNSDSMLMGDNWIGSVVSAIENGPDWSSTAVFITYDDCGCFYDHVVPPGKFGMRVPMVIVSPYAKPGYSDSTEASYASLLAFTEHTFGLAPLNADDSAAYDYTNTFDYSQPPNPPIRTIRSQIPRSELAYISAHPGDPNDPT